MTDGHTCKTALQQEKLGRVDASRFLAAVLDVLESVNECTSASTILRG